MNITFISNYFNHHQKNFSDCLNNKKDITFTFIATSKISDERRKLGYDNSDIPEYVTELLPNQENKRALDAIVKADVIILGMAPEYLVKDHIRQGKLLFRYSERPFKNGIDKLELLPRSIKWHICNPYRKPIYMLCASAYTASDFLKIGMFKNKSYSWGYFPDFKKYSNINDLIRKKDTHEILWCGRFLDWKHPDDALKAAKMLKDSGYRFKMRFIGTGPLSDELNNFTYENKLENCVEFSGPMSPEKVREHMENSGVFLITSDFKEGWGAVLNESMNSGCAVVASHAVGSAPCLIKNRYNGLIYKSGNVSALFEKIRYLIDNTDEQKRLGNAAYKTICNEWNAEIATKRLIKLINNLLQGERFPDLYAEGPCSKSLILNNDWYGENQSFS